MDVKNTFIRTVELESLSPVVTLEIQQCEIGDVGCVVWDAGLVLSKYLDFQNSHSAKRNFLKDKHVIDLGSGTGVVGLTAACLGAVAVLTDLDELVPLLESNIKLNFTKLLGTARSMPLNWSQENHDYKLPFQYILVGDCFYYEDSLKPLIDTINRLAGPETEILLSYEERTEGNNPRIQELSLKLIKENFVMTEIPPEEQHPEFQSPDIHILSLKKLPKNFGL